MPSCLCTSDLARDFTLPLNSSPSLRKCSCSIMFVVLLFVFHSPLLLSLSSVFLCLPPSCQFCAIPASVHSLGSTGSETVTRSSLVIGHGHANQTGRNLQLIRILPPAIIVPPHPPIHTHHRPDPLTPHPDKINYIRGSIPTIGFPVLKLHFRRRKNPKTTQPSYFFNYRKTG